MPELPPILISALMGFGSGLLLSIPVGPVNLTIMNEGAQRGFRHAALIAIGAMTMELTYCAIAFTGFATFLQNEYVQAAMELGSFVFMLGLGLWFLMAKANRPPSKIGGRIEEKLEEKLHPRTAFWTGFVRVLGNPGVPVSWVFFSALFISHGWVQQTVTSKTVCVLGVVSGTGLWFFTIAWAVSLGHKKFSKKTLLRMERGSGIGLLVLAMGYGCEIVWQIHHGTHFSHLLLKH
jgi:threonine/homoserine/homoserine lactone efflux protein